jgi:hypothetical protein
LAAPEGRESISLTQILTLGHAKLPTSAFWMLNAQFWGVTSNVTHTSGLLFYFKPS